MRFRLFGQSDLDMSGLSLAKLSVKMLILLL